MVDYNALKERLNKEDRFCAYNGIRLTEIREGYAEAELTVTEHSLNRQRLHNYGFRNINNYEEFKR